MKKIRQYILEMAGDFVGKGTRGYKNFYRGMYHSWDPYEYDELKNIIPEIEKDIKMTKEKLKHETDQDKIDELDDALRILKDQEEQTKLNLTDLEAAKKKRETWGSHPEQFGIFGKRMSKGLSTAKDIADAIQAMIQIGSTVAMIIRTIYNWKDSIKNYLALRKRQKTIKNISYIAAALAKSVRDNETQNITKIINQIRLNSDIQGQQPLTKIMVAEIAIAFSNENILDKYDDIIQKAFPRHYNHSIIKHIISNARDVRYMDTIVQEELDNYARNINKYIKNMRIRRQELKKQKDLLKSVEKKIKK